MSALKLEKFGGMLPAWDPFLLPQGQASYCQNGYLFSGTLVGWREPKRLRDLTRSTSRFAYRLPSVTKAQARAFLVFKAQPNDGDTVSIGDLTYTFKTALTVLHGSGGLNLDVIGQPFEVLIGVNTFDTATHLAQAITADNGENTNSGVNYGENTPLNGDIAYVLPDTDPIAGIMPPTVSQDTVDGTPDYVILGVGSVDFGASFNRIKISESTSNARVTWLYITGLGYSFANTTTTLQGGINPTFNSKIDAPATWLEFDDPDTNVFKSPVVDDTFDRYYFASPSDMPKYSTRERIEAGKDPWLLGVPPPGCAVTLDVTGGGNTFTLGNSTTDGGSEDALPNRIYLLKITPTGATQIQDVNIVGDKDRFPTIGYPDAHWHGVLYDDTDGKPDNLLNTGVIQNGLNADILNTSPFTNPTNLSANTDYWVGIAIDTAVHAFSTGPSGSVPGHKMATFPNTFTNGPPTTAPSLTLAHTQLTSDGVNPNDGDLMTIGGVHYRFVTGAPSATFNPLDIKIGANADATLANVEKAINGTGVPGTDYGNPGGLAAESPHPQVSSAAVVGHAIVITQLNSTIGDGTNIPTTFTPVSVAHLSFPDTTLQVGYSDGLTEFNMYANALSDDVIESRSYVYTWVSAYGEEGPPSPPTLLDGWSNGTWTLGLWQPPPNDLGVLRDLRKINIYRTVPGQGGSTVFFFVKQVDIGTTFFIDDIKNDTVALNDQLQSTNWFPPPENLEGMVVMQNGMVAGFKGNEVWFCEPYHPHAWPPSYVNTVDFPIVGMGVTAGSLVVCTNANPFVLSGSAPASVTQLKCADPNPCSSRASILSGDGAVTYHSPNGLIQVTGGGAATNTTDLWITREKWQQLTPQHDCRAIQISSCYMGVGTISRDGQDNSVAQDGFTVELAQDNTSFSIWPQPGGHRLGFQDLDEQVDGLDNKNIFVDPWTSVALVIADDGLYYYDFTDPAPDLSVVTWRSKYYQQNAKRNFSAMKCFFTIPPGAPALNPTRIEAECDDPIWQTLPDDRYGFIKTYVDLDGLGNLRLVDCREIRESGELLRIVDGFKADSWVWEIVSRVAISNLQIATAVKELASV